MNVKPKQLGQNDPQPDQQMEGPGAAKVSDETPRQPAAPLAANRKVKTGEFSGSKPGDEVANLRPGDEEQPAVPNAVQR